MTEDQWAFGWDQIIASAETAVIATAALLAYIAANQFRREKIDVRQAELAEECLALAYHSRDVINSIRNPFAEIPIDKVSDKNYVYKQKLEKIKNYKDHFDKIIDIRPRIKAVFGPKSDDDLAVVLVIRGEIGYAAGDLIHEAEEMEKDELKRNRAIVFGRGDDEIAGRLNQMIDALENRFGAILKSKYRVS